MPTPQTRRLSIHTTVFTTVLLIHESTGYLPVARRLAGTEASVTLSRQFVLEGTDSEDLSHAAHAVGPKVRRLAFAAIVNVG
ncbi:MAG: hypothetical protein KatS3mg114_0689 [Planctomycetaceae bacterium]|nr:MAG: hypothetical protein KatS3mg114_0689 [Planctomycetaceae bacterium]